MMDPIEAHPEVEVLAADYQRLLGYPPRVVLDGRAAELAEWAHQWYRLHGRPWIYARQAASATVAGGTVTIEGLRFHGGALGRRCQRAAADSVILAAVSAGPQIEREARKLWREDKPDEYYFLEVFGSAVVERLTAMAGGLLCAWAENHALAVLPHDSPGYPEWDIAEQSRLLGLLKAAGHLPGELGALASGALRPKKSLLAVFPLTRHTEGVRRLTELVACESCSSAGCHYRRLRRN